MPHSVNLRDRAGMLGESLELVGNKNEVPRNLQAGVKGQGNYCMEESLALDSPLMYINILTALALGNP